MEIWQDGVLAGLAAVGLTAILWLLAEARIRWGRPIWWRRPAARSSWT